MHSVCKLSYVTVKVAELFLDLTTECGPEMDLETFKMISSCANCTEYYEEVSNRLDVLEQRFNAGEQSLRKLDGGQEELEDNTPEQIDEWQEQPLSPQSQPMSVEDSEECTTETV